MRPKQSRPAEVERVALRLGFRFERSRGSHRLYRHPDGRRVVIAFHPGTIPTPTLKKIVTDLGISTEEFNRMV